MSADLDLWNDVAGDWDRDIARPGSFRTHLITSALEELLPNLKGKQVLDAGCGNGFFTNWMQQKGADVHGVDGSQKMIQLAAANFPDLHFEVADLTQPLQNNIKEYDYILANMLLMHMDNIATFLSDARKRLKPDGCLIISVLHPCFNEPTSYLYKTLLMRLTRVPPFSFAVNYYHKETGRHESHMGTTLTHYHRTLEEYSKEFNIAGFAITRMTEPHQLPKEFLKLHPKMEYAERLPRFIFFNCQPI